MSQQFEIDRTGNDSLPRTWDHIDTNFTRATGQAIIADAAYTLTSQQAAQQLFAATTNGEIFVPVGVYEFECQFSLSSMSASSGSFGFAIGVGQTGGATLDSQFWGSSANKATLATAAQGYQTWNTAANTALTAAGTGTVGAAVITGIIRVSTAGFIQPQVSLGVAAAAVVGKNSYFRIWQRSDAYADAVFNAPVASGNMLVWS